MKQTSGLLQKIYRFFSVKVIVISVIVFVLFMVFVLPAASDYAQSISGSSDSPDTSLIYSADDLYEMAQSFGPQGRRSYIIMRFTFDLVWPIVYLAFMLAVLVGLLRSFNDDKKIKKLVYLPIIGTLLDFLENIFAAITIGRFPLRTPIIAELTPIFTISKWAVLGLSFVLIIALVFYHLYRLISKKIRSSSSQKTHRD